VRRFRESPSSYRIVSGLIVALGVRALERASKHKLE